MKRQPTAGSGSVRGGGAVALAFALGLGWADAAYSACTTSLTNGVNTRTCTGPLSGQQQVRGGNTEEKLIFQSGTLTSTGNGILGRDDSGAGTVTIQIDGGTVDVDGSGINFDMGRSSTHPNGHSNVDLNGGLITAGGTGININHRPASTGGRITFDMSGGSIGTSADRVSTGLAAGIQATGNTQTIDLDLSGGSIHATGRGLQLSHSGTGLIDLDIGSTATIETSGTGNRGAGVFVSRSGSGMIQIDNAGRITSGGHDGIFVLNENDGAVTINHQSGGVIRAGNYGIYLRHGNANTGGNAAVSVTSGGDITTTGSTGIFLDLARGDATADDQVRVSLTGGTISAANTGVHVNSRTRGGLSFDMSGGAIGTADSPVGQIGVSLALTSAQNSNDLDVELTGGRIHAVHRGLSLSRSGGGDIDLDLGTGVIITTQNSITPRAGLSALTRGTGVWAFHSGSGAITIDSAGTINSGLGGGIYAWHNGSGPLRITNTGSITAGFQGIEARRGGSGTVSVQHSGTITASSGPGIYVRHDAARTSNLYDVNVRITGDVTTTDPNQTAVRAETRTGTGTAGINIHHEAGTIRGNEGIFAGSLRFSGSTYTGPTPAGFQVPLSYDRSYQPVINVVIGGGTAEAKIIAGGELAPRSDFAAAMSDHQVGWVSRRLAGTSVGSTAVDGVTVAGTDYQTVGTIVAAGDKEVTDITAEIRAQFRAIKRASIAYGATPDNPGLGNLLDPRNLTGAFVGDLSDDSAIDTFLTGANLETFREFTLTRQEKMVLEAIYGTSDLETALAALPTSYTDDYKNRVRWYAGAYNDADLSVDVRRNGIIQSRSGDGIRLIRRFPSGQNGSSRVVIHPGGLVTAHRYGIRMIGGRRIGNEIRGHIVEVHGELESTGPNGATIALQGGGYVDIGRDAVLRSASGTTIKVDQFDETGNPLTACLRTPCEGDNLVPGTNLVVQIDRKDGEDIAQTFARAVPGQIVNAGPTRVLVEQVIDGTQTYQLVPVRRTVTPVTPPPRDPSTPTGPTGGGGSPSDDEDPGANPRATDASTSTWLTLTAAPSSAPDPDARLVAGAYGVWMDCAGTGCALRNVLEPRARVAEALPAILLEMTPAPHRGPQRAGTGSWARLIASSATRDRTDSTAGTSYSLDRTGVALGTDFTTPDGNLFGLSLHRQTGAAEITDGGEIDTTATGMGLSWHWDRGALTWGVRAGATAFSSDLTSSARGALMTGLSGTGWMAGLTAARNFALEEATLTIEGELTRSQVEADGFTAHLPDPAAGGITPVPVQDIQGTDTTLRLRGAWQTPTGFGSWFAGGGVDIPLDSQSEARIGNTRLTSRTRGSLHLTSGLVITGTDGETALLSLGAGTDRGGDSVTADLRFSF